MIHSSNVHIKCDNKASSCTAPRFKKPSQLDLQTLESRREELCLNFALQCTKNNKMQHIFPLNSKTHSMNTRMEEKYEVKHANTDRLRNSAIIYMQNLLNEHERRKSN
jgi:cell division septum initiation protein DivIVA